jgi:hypothetical protein
MNYFLVDFENVKSRGLEGIADLGENDNVVIFYSDNVNTITFDMHFSLMKTKANVELKKVYVGSKNALDFQLSSYLGYLIKANEGQNAVYHIVTGDLGFRFLKQFWVAAGERVFIFKDLTSKGTPKVKIKPEAEITAVTFDGGQAEMPSSGEKATNADTEKLADSGTAGEKNAEKEESVKKSAEITAGAAKGAQSSAEKPAESEENMTKASRKPTDKIESPAAHGENIPRRAEKAESGDDKAAINTTAQKPKNTSADREVASGAKEKAEKTAITATGKSDKREKSKGKSTEIKEDTAKTAKKPALNGEKNAKEFIYSDESQVLAMLEEVLPEEGTASQVWEILQTAGTKQEVNSALMKRFPGDKNRRAGKFYRAIKPFLEDL